MKTSRFACIVLVVLSTTVTALALPPAKNSDKTIITDFAASIDNTHYINANNILMFVTNYGSFARDLAGVFGNDYGTYYPYTSVADIVSGANVTSPLYAAGLWLGGKVNGQTRVTVAEYSSEYVPGLMIGGTFVSDNPGFRVYKLYRDSLADNPNADYLNWPANEGAPINPDRSPRLKGDQMAWAVFNDADGNQHDNDAGSTPPLGIEVRVIAWAYEPVIKQNDTFAIDVYPNGPSSHTVEAYVVDPTALTGHNYRVTISGDSLLWSDITSGSVAFDSNFFYSNIYNDTIVTPVVDGIQLVVTPQVSGSFFEEFEVVSNANGPLTPSEGGAMNSAGFPSAPITDRQQVGDSKWILHTGDSPTAPRPTYQDFLNRTFRADLDRIDRFRFLDFEIRLTGSYENPGIGGSYAWNWATDRTAIWVPFELWATGATPNYPADDIRLVPYIYGGDSNGVFNLSCYGSDPNCGPFGCEHSASDGDDDPHTDWFYWRLPTDVSFGQAGYLAFEQAMIADPGNYPGLELPIMDRFTFVSLDAGSSPPFDQSLPEMGTVFRLTSMKNIGISNRFDFKAPLADDVLYPGDITNTIYVTFQILNRSNNLIEDMYMGIWADPDLGGPSDDLVGCDTLDQVWYCYNGDNDDIQYGNSPPAIGFKLLAGPAVPSPGDTAFVNGDFWPDYRNLGLTSFSAYKNGTDPISFTESYNYLQGLEPDGSTHMVNGLPNRFWYTGDPVSATGDRDSQPSDRRMMAGFGPFDLPTLTLRQLDFKIGVGQGGDRLSSLTVLKMVLGSNFPPPSCCTGFRGNVTGDINDQIDIADLIYLVQYLYVGGPPPLCIEEGDVTGNGLTDIADLAVLVGYMFRDGPAPVSCM